MRVARILLMQGVARHWCGTVERRGSPSRRNPKFGGGAQAKLYKKAGTATISLATPLICMCICAAVVLLIRP